MMEPRCTRCEDYAWHQMLIPNDVGYSFQGQIGQEDMMPVFVVCELFSRSCYQEIAMKSWSYKAIAKEAEHEINRLIKLSDEADTDFDKTMFKYWAYGVFIGWQNLTRGWMNDGDCERMESLTKIKSK